MSYDYQLHFRELPCVAYEDLDSVSWPHILDASGGGFFLLGFPQPKRKCGRHVVALGH